MEQNPGETRPVVVVQTDLLKNHHPCTIVCLPTTQIHPRSGVLKILESSKIPIHMIVGASVREKRQRLKPYDKSWLSLLDSDGKEDWSEGSGAAISRRLEGIDTI